MWKVAMITASDRASRDERFDDSGPVIQELIQTNLESELMTYRILPDDIETLKENMIEICDRTKQTFSLPSVERA